MTTDILLLIGGLITLVIGGEALVRGAVGVAQKAKISTLVIGMTVVSFGTSAPELLVSLQATLGGHADIAIGNVVGSNVANIALVLGLTVLIFPIVVERDTLRIDWPVMMVTSLLLWLFIQDEILVRWEGITLVVLLLSFTTWLIWRSRRKQRKEAADASEEEDSDPTWKALVYLLVGLVGLYFGADWLLEGAVSIAEEMGMSERVIGITIVAFGTSVPELVTSCVAAFRKQTDISVGNLIGSNIFNIMAVLGVTATVSDVTVAPKILEWDIWWMLGIAAVLLPMMLVSKKIGRLQGVLLFGTYLVYVVLLLITPSL